jgi:uncharacterized peroxidase-related enzyme
MLNDPPAARRPSLGGAAAPGLTPLTCGDWPVEFDGLFALTEQVMGFVPNSLLLMARDPDLLAAFAQLSAVVVVRPGRVDAGLKALVMQIASATAGCRYCWAHSANLAATHHVAPEKAAALWDYERSPLFSEVERAVLRLAQLAARVPSDVTDETFAALRNFLEDDQILEIVAVIAFMGFLNRWNDTLATPLEAAPRSFAERHLAGSGWSIGRHGGRRETTPLAPRALPLKTRLVMWLLRRWAPKPRAVIEPPRRNPGATIDQPKGRQI